MDRAKRQLAEIEQHRLDVEHWNSSTRKPNEDPIDWDPDGQLRAQAEGFRRFIAQEDGKTGPFTMKTDGTLINGPVH